MSELKLSIPSFHGEVSMSESENSEYDLIVYLNAAFSDPRTTNKLCDKLVHLPEGSTVEIVINSPGGSVSALLAILAAMKASKATFTTNCVGVAASCGFFLWIHGDKLKMSDYSVLMIHGSSSGGLSGNTDFIHEHTGKIIELIRSLGEVAVAKNIITPDELEDALVKKQDIFITRQDLVIKGVM